MFSKKSLSSLQSTCMWYFHKLSRNMWKRMYILICQNIFCMFFFVSNKISYSCCLWNRKKRRIKEIQREMKLRYKSYLSYFISTHYYRLIYAMNIIFFLLFFIITIYRLWGKYLKMLTLHPYWYNLKLKIWIIFTWINNSKKHYS